MRLFGDTTEEEDDGLSSIFGAQKGSWWVHCKSDPRWNGSGSSRVGGFTIPSDAAAHIARKKKELGEPPADVEWGYMKD